MIATPAWPRSLPRLYVEPPLSAGFAVGLDSAQANYLGNVLRLKKGDGALLFDGVSGEWLAQVVEADRKRMSLGVCRQTKVQESVPDLTLAFAPIKKGKLEWLVEKAVELGVSRLQPVITHRSIVDKVNLQRLRAHIIEAAEQCGRTALATIAEPVKLSAFLKEQDGAQTLYFADETGGETVTSAMQCGAATILIGPEGGFTEEERNAIRAAPGALAISLGPRILRAETAALAAVTAYMALAGDWRAS
ncbi:MAG: 16S rRNA (uracil(1498)-N(3))-methyltransferase [Sphingomicrobium sp.]